MARSHNAHEREAEEAEEDAGEKARDGKKGVQREESGRGGNRWRELVSQRFESLSRRWRPGVSSARAERQTGARVNLKED